MIKNIHKFVLYTVVIVVLPILLFILITSRSSAFFGIRSFNVLTGSMEPVIHVGSMIFTKPAQTYIKGDVITFKRGEITITHRVVAISNNTYETKGDANKSDDPIKVQKFNIIGKNIIAIPFGGYISSFVKTIPGFILIVALPILLFIFFEAKTIKEEFEKGIEKKLRKELNEQKNYE